MGIIVQVEDLVTVLSQRLNLHTRDTVDGKRLKISPKCVFVINNCNLLIPLVSGYRAGDAVVAVEQLPPQELISGDSQPLIMGQTQEDLQHQAVWQNWATLHNNILPTQSIRHLEGDVFSSLPVNHLR
uniref:Uncharacterized protein n=1 Tax=Seriola lalandi dorsalis TaxID=1841481 RepID=A0A3B4X7R3_SERLL